MPTGHTCAIATVYPVTTKSASSGRPTPTAQSGECPQASTPYHRVSGMAAPTVEDDSRTS
ncbi:hypothetical protein [uncultured Duncaniella sp.]|uniref:hypothetical protein n=1 Tax=uncultured Duncaniella sp. TaxID=2768039 RepID=UPI002648450C|nr:hypothetical protein [uncultured Duncaniella sp.]